MTFNRYSIQIITRVLLIAVTIFLLFYYVNQSDRIMTVGALAFLVALQTGLLIRFSTKYLKYISDFLDIVGSSEYSSRFNSKHSHKDLKSLQNSFNRIGQALQQVKIEKESSGLFYKYAFDKISIGILAFDEEDHIEVLNDAARNGLKIGHFSNINELEGPYPDFPRWLKLKSPNTQTIYTLKVGNRFEKFLFTISEVSVLQKIVKIVSFQNVEQEIGKSELAAYKKLIRILTHEIMNSVTPITSLSVANRHILGDSQPLKDISDLENSDLNDLYINNVVLEERSKGLMDFVERFREISLLPLPSKQTVAIQDLFQEIYRLYKTGLDEAGIQIQTQVVPEGLSLLADKSMVTQVLINLMKNSIQALRATSSGLISLKAHMENNEVIIHITDNGHGIEENSINDVFVPFFSTREKGSGIGLSYSREVMLLHGGRISVASVPGEMTTFELSFTD